MATSGQTDFTLDIQEILEESAERASIDKQLLNADHARSARRSMNLILTAWGNLNIRPWALELRKFTTSEGKANRDFDNDVIDAIDFTLERENYEIPMDRISRSDYQSLPDKAIQGRPDRIFVHKKRDAPEVFLYQTPDNSTDIVHYWAILRLQTVVGSQENADIPTRFLEAFIADLSYRLYAKKDADERDQDEMKRLRVESVVAFNDARKEDSERADLQVVPYYAGAGNR